MDVIIPISSWIQSLLNSEKNTNLPSRFTNFHRGHPKYFGPFSAPEIPQSPCRRWGGWMVPSSCQGLGEWKWLVGSAFVPLPPGTLDNHSLMDGNGETSIFLIKIWNHPTEITIKKSGCLGYQVSKVQVSTTFFVDGSEVRRYNQLRLVDYPYYLQGFFTFQVVVLGFP